LQDGVVEVCRVPANVMGMPIVKCPNGAGGFYYQASFDVRHRQSVWAERDADPLLLRPTEPDRGADRLHGQQRRRAVV